MFFTSVSRDPYKKNLKCNCIIYIIAFPNILTLFIFFPTKTFSLRARVLPPPHWRTCPLRINVLEELRDVNTLFPQKCKDLYPYISVIVSKVHTTAYNPICNLCLCMFKVLYGCLLLMIFLFRCYRKESVFFL